MNFTITTADPRFNPAEPVVINGYLYLPARGETISQPLTKKPRDKVVVQVGRRRRIVTV